MHYRAWNFLGWESTGFHNKIVAFQQQIQWLTTCFSLPLSSALASPWRQKIELVGRGCCLVFFFAVAAKDSTWAVTVHRYVSEIGRLVGFLLRFRGEPSS